MLNDYIGQITTLKVMRETDFGYFLSDGEEDVLLHKNDCKGAIELDTDIDVFLYTDSYGRITATNILPNITVGVYGWAKVVSQSDLGAFIDIGIKKDMLLGADDLPVYRSVWPKEGDLVYITLRVHKNGLIYVKLATDQIFDEMKITATTETFNKNIHGHIYRTAKVGSWIYTSEGYKGFIHESVRGTEPRLGQKVEGRVIDVKEDGTINVALTLRKEESLDKDANDLYMYLESRNGAMPYWDKSDAEDINRRFGLSKAAFKRALGRLMKEGKITQENGWTYIKKEE